MSVDRQSIQVNYYLTLLNRQINFSYFHFVLMRLHELGSGRCYSGSGCGKKDFETKVVLFYFVGSLLSISVRR